MLCLLLAVGCGKDKISYEDNSSTDGSSSSEYGYLVLPQSIYVDLSSENFDEQQTTKASSGLEADDNYLVTITRKSDSLIVYDLTYGELKAMDQIELYPGQYTIDVRSTDDIPLLCDVAHYAVSEDFTIVSGLETTIDALLCTMSNIKVSVSFSVDMLALFKEDGDDESENLKVDVALGQSIATYGRAQSGEVNYFQAVELSNALEIELSGMYNTAAANEPAAYTMIEGWKQSITGVKAGQWRNISISVEHANAGTVDFSITITTWTYDQGIDVDVTSTKFQASLTEPELDDPENYITDADAPVVSQGDDGQSLANSFYIDHNSFALNSSLQAICVDPLILSVETSDGAELTDLWIEFDSDNSDFDALLQSSLGEKCREYILPATAASAYYTIDGNTFEASYAAMYQLYLYAGEHKATIMAKDSQGRTSYSYLTIVSSNDGVDIPTSDPPTIEWRGGVDLDATHVVDPVDGLEVIIDISSETGITGFTMTINSDVLTPEELSGINLAQTMDLINPGDCEAGLVFLGFPTGEQVKGQTEMEFDISSFMPQLLALGAGDSDFVLTVTDAGGTTSVTLHIRVE